MSKDGVTPPNNALFNAGAAALNFTKDAPKLKSGDGNLRVHRYPSNVGDEDIPHYVMFFISKRRGDIGAETPTVSKKLNVDVSNVNRANLQGAALKTVGTAAFIAGGAKAGAQFVSEVASAAALDQTNVAELQTVVSTTKILGAVAGAGIGAGAAGTTKVFDNRDLTTLKESIALYLTGTPSASYKAIWQDKDVGILAGFAEQFGSAFSQGLTGIRQVGDALSDPSIEGFKTAADTLKNAAAQALRVGASGAVSIGLANAPKFEGIGDLGALISSGAGVAVNPFRTQLFQNMGFRTFSFTYNFLPKSETEYRQVKNIIKTFKKYMHPTLSQDKIIMGYPAEFSIAYYYGNEQNKELFKIGNCALTDMQVNYGGTDFITFRDTVATKGAPAEISIQLQFTELEILTEQKIEDDY